MKHEIDEQLSALADGEIGPDEARFLLRRIESDQVLRARLGRYALIASAMRDELAAVAPAGFAADVMSRIEAEAAPARQRGGGFLKIAGGLAIAAGVAAVALVSVAPPDTATEAPPLAANAPAPAALPAPTLAQPTPIRTDDLLLPFDSQPASAGFNPPLMSAQAPTVYDPQLEGYLIRHSNALRNQSGGLLPYVYVISTPRRPASADEAAAAARAAGSRQ